MYLTKELLVRFYGVLNFSLRTLVHYRMLAAFRKPFDYFLVEEPWRVIRSAGKSPRQTQRRAGYKHPHRLAEEKRIQRDARPGFALSDGPGGVGLIYDFSVSHSYVAVAVGEEL